jgi:CBS domain-containing protein
MSKEETSSPTLVRDLMSIGVLTCSPDTSIVELTRILLEKELEGVVVLDDQGHAAGVVGRQELIRAYSTGEYEYLTAEKVMQDGVPQIPPDIPLTAAAQIMQDRGQRIMFLMHHAGGIEYPAAMLSYKNMLRHMLETFIKRRDEARDRTRLG